MNRRLPVWLMGVVVLVVAAAAQAQVDERAELRELRESVKKLTVERDQLRAQMAAALLEIEKLQNKVATLAAEVAAKPAGATVTQGSDSAAPHGEGDADADAAGVEVRSTAEIEDALAATRGEALTRQEWIVEVLHNEPQDVAQLKAQLEATRRELSVLEGRVSSARRNATRAADPTIAGKWTYSSSGNGSVRERELSHDQKRVLSAAQSAARRSEAQLNAARQKQTRLEQAIADRQNARVIEAITDEGAHVRIFSTGPAKVFGDSMKVGQRYRISGTGTLSGGVTRIQLRTALAE